MTTPRMMRILFGGIVGIGIGCEAQPHASTVDSRADEPLVSRAASDQFQGPTQQQPEKPDLTRLAYNPDKRKLTLYDLPERSARWMLMMPGKPMGIPVESEYEFPAGLECDVEQITIFYTVPNRRPSPTVTLREIQESGDVKAQR